MARSRNVQAEEEVVEAAEEVAVEAAQEAVEKEVVAEQAVSHVRVNSRDSLTVTWRGGSREYSRAVHGEDFVALAQEFVTKKKGTIV